jgi:cyanophycinase-like exopeptidase
MWIDINKGYISESTIEYVERKVDGSATAICIHLVSGRTIDITGELSRRILEYVDSNKVQFVDQLYNPVGLNGITL